MPLVVISLTYAVKRKPEKFFYGITLHSYTRIYTRTTYSRRGTWLEADFVKLVAKFKLILVPVKYFCSTKYYSVIFIEFAVEPVKPSINVHKFSQDIPLGDGSPVTMDIGDNVTASSKTALTIKCPVSGVPEPSVTWTKDGLKIVSGLKYSFTNDESLVIEGPETVDSGEYTCSAKSFLGTDSKTSTVKFLGQL